jgi:hypothetical protein
LLVFIGLVHFDDGGVVALPQDGDFVYEGLLVLYVFLLDDFNGPDGVRVLFGLGFVDSAICAFAQDLR